MRFFICGSALTGQPDHKNLSDAKRLGAARTAKKYRLHSVNGVHPGIYETDRNGISILGELYELTPEQHAKLIAGEPPDIYEATIEMDDGSAAQAMLFPRELIVKHDYEDISVYGGWASYKADT